MKIRWGFVLLLLAGCGGGTIDVTGHLAGQKWTCNAGGQAVSRTVLGTILSPQGVDPAGKTLTFKDAAGKIVGTVTASDSRWIRVPGTPIPDNSLGLLHPCQEVADFSVSLPRSSFYSIEIAGVPAPLTVKLADVQDGTLEVSVS